MISALVFIIQAFAHLFLLLLLLRFWLPWFGADFRNPIAQGILRLTSPLIIPVRRVIPPVGKLDTATVIVAFGIQYLTILVVLALRQVAAGIAPIAITALIDLGMLSLRLFIFAIIIRIVLSWVAPHTYNPVTSLVSGISDPLLRPFRRFVPPLGGLDISPVFALILFGAFAIMLGELRPLPI